MRIETNFKQLTVNEFTTKLNGQESLDTNHQVTSPS